jgi:hypothetical protein
MVNSLTNAVQFGLRQAEANGKKFEIVVPLYSELMARGAGKNVAGIFGSHELALVARKRAWRSLFGYQCLRQVVRRKVRLPAQPGCTYLLCPDHAVRRCGHSRQVVRPLRGGRSSRRLRIRRHGQRPDPLSCRRPPVLQGRGLWCAARRTRRTNSIFWKSLRSLRPSRSPTRLTTRSSPVATWAPATPAPDLKRSVKEKQPVAPLAAQPARLRHVPHPATP